MEWKGGGGGRGSRKRRIREWKQNSIVVVVVVVVESLDSRSGLPVPTTVVVVRAVSVDVKRH